MSQAVPESASESAFDLRPEERQPCEVWTRVMGYHRPVSQFNPGKQSEHAERLHFREERMGREGSTDL